MTGFFQNAWKAFVGQGLLVVTAEGVIVSIVVLVAMFWERLVWFFVLAFKTFGALITGAIARKKSGVPDGSLRIVPLPTSRWQLGYDTTPGNPCLILHVHLRVTNCYGHAIELPTAYLRKPRGDIGIVVNPLKIPPQNPGDVTGSCTIQPPPKVTHGQPFKADVVIVDQYDVKHKTSVIFHPLG